jgi:peptidoglycan/LPS O-acetylase OafA/YrhL
VLAELDFRSNSIGFLRLFFAAIVVWSHAYDLGGFGDDPIARLNHGLASAGFLAVGGFFVLSGFLITRSFERSGGLARFLWHRFLRIFPAFWVCLIAVAFGFAPLLFLGQHGTLTGFIDSHDSPWTFVARNALLQLNQLNVAGPFNSIPFPLGLNGSLWTLHYEFNCYLAVAVFGVLGIFSQKRMMVAVTFFTFFVISTLLASGLGMHPTAFGLQVLELYVYFSAGACAYVFRDRIAMRWWIVVACFFALIVAMPTRAFAFVVPPCIAYGTLFAAMKLPLRNFDRRMDLSYGLYIYAFPVQQLLAMYRVNTLGLLPYFLCALAVALGLAVASWFAVERPSLSLKNSLFAPLHARP